MIGNDEKLGWIGKWLVLREPLRVGMPVRADQRQVPHITVEPPGNLSQCGISGEKPVVMSQVSPAPRKDNRLPATECRAFGTRTASLYSNLHCLRANGKFCQPAFRWARSFYSFFIFPSAASFSRKRRAVAASVPSA